MKIYSFFIQMSTLVFLSYYFVSLEATLSDISTFGGHSFKEDGMYMVPVWTEKEFYHQALISLVVPIDMGSSWMSLSDMEDFTKEHHDSYYLMLVSVAQILQLKGN
jgi:hypothetical protein